jgi:hypothetical protein
MTVIGPGALLLLLLDHVLLNMLKRQNRNMTVPLDDNVDFTDNKM